MCQLLINEVILNLDILCKYNFAILIAILWYFVKLSAICNTLIFCNTYCNTSYQTQYLLQHLRMLQEQSVAILLQYNTIGSNPAQNHKTLYQRKQHHHTNPSNKSPNKYQKSHTNSNIDFVICSLLTPYVIHSYICMLYIICLLNL